MRAREIDLRTPNKSHILYFIEWCGPGSYFLKVNFWQEPNNEMQMLRLCNLRQICLWGTYKAHSMFSLMLFISNTSRPLMSERHLHLEQAKPIDVYKYV